MFRSNAKSYPDIREFLDNIPVIDTHQHFTGYDGYPNAPFYLGYLMKDLSSAALDKAKLIEKTLNEKAPASEEGIRAIVEAYKLTDKTAYSRGFMIGMKECRN